MDDPTINPGPRPEPTFTASVPDLVPVPRGEIRAAHPATIAASLLGSLARLAVAGVVFGLAAWGAWMAIEAAADSIGDRIAARVNQTR
jgi:hypothetical protein